MKDWPQDATDGRWEYEYFRTFRRTPNFRCRSRVLNPFQGWEPPPMMTQYENMTYLDDDFMKKEERTTKIKCFICMAENSHTTKYCPMAVKRNDKKCRKCGEVGHTVYECPYIKVGVNPQQGNARFRTTTGSRENRRGPTYTRATSTSSSERGKTWEPYPTRTTSWPSDGSDHSGDNYYNKRDPSPTPSSCASWHKVTLSDVSSQDGGADLVRPSARQQSSGPSSSSDVRADRSRSATGSRAPSGSHSWQTTNDDGDNEYGYCTSCKVVHHRSRITRALEPGYDNRFTCEICSSVEKFYFLRSDSSKWPGHLQKNYVQFTKHGSLATAGFKVWGRSDSDRWSTQSRAGSATSSDYRGYYQDRGASSGYSHRSQSRYSDRSDRSRKSSSRY